MMFTMSGCQFLWMSVCVYICVYFRVFGHMDRSFGRREYMVSVSIIFGLDDRSILLTIYMRGFERVFWFWLDGRKCPIYICYARFYTPSVDGWWGPHLIQLHGKGVRTWYASWSWRSCRFTSNHTSRRSCEVRWEIAYRYLKHNYMHNTCRWETLALEYWIFKDKQYRSW